MGDYSDDVGCYSGELKDGYPHGKGIKIYNEGKIYDGYWEKGRKHGLGLEDFVDSRVKIKYSHGIPVKILDFPFNILDTYRAYFSFKITFKSVGDYYKEVEMSQDKLYENIYILYFHPSSKNMCFRGKLFKKDEIQLSFARMSEIYLAFEKNKKNELKGRLDIICKHFSYIGYGENILPNGQGKAYFSDGSKVSGNFIKRVLQGHGKIKTHDLNMEAEFDDGIPTGNVRYLYQGIPGNIFMNIPTIKIYSNALIPNSSMVTLADLFEAIMSKIVILKEFIFSIPSLTIIQNKDIFPHQDIFDDTIENAIADIDITFKQCKSWNEYETKLSCAFGIEKVVRDEDVYIGDTSKGKGKILFNNGEIYKGQVVNRNIHGFGKYWYKDGSVYIGEFVKGKKHGIGMMIYDDKHYYKGHWKNDEKCGQGIWKNDNKQISCFSTMKGPVFNNFLGIFTEGFY